MAAGDLSNWPLVSVLFLTYSRFDLLERTVKTLLDNTDYPRLELVVSDDGSPPAVQEAIRALPVDRMVLLPKNRGFGANANAGLRECQGRYILFLQDDWECRGPRNYLFDSVAAMEAHPNVGFIRFYGLNESEDRTRILDPIQDLRQIEPPSILTDRNRNLYSDTPHIKSRAFCDFIGPYTERARIEEIERDYQLRFLRQNKFRACYFPRYMGTVFVHMGESKSFRSRSKVSRLEGGLYSLAAPLKTRCTPVYHLLRSGYRGGLRLFYRLGLLR